MAALDTIDKIAHQLLLHCPLAGLPLARVWAINALSRLADLYDRWSWRTGYGQFNIPASYSTGTVAISSADPTLLTFTGATLTPSMVGRSIQLASAIPYELIEYVDSSHMRIALPWGDADVTGSAFEIFQQYVEAPDDFMSFLSVVDPTRNQRLRTGVQRRSIDRRDPRRTSRGNPCVLAEAGLSPAYSGSVDTTPFVAAGSGTVPTFGGSYSGPVDTVYIIEILTTALTGISTFRWRRGAGSWSPATLTDAGGVGLSGGIFANFADGATYTAGNIFVARAKAALGSGKPRYEVWPAATTQCVLPYYYLTTPPDASVTGYTLPRTVRGDVVLKGALAEACAWAGRGSEANPLYDLRAAAKNVTEFERMVDILSLRDDEIYPQAVSYWQELPFAGPWDASWEQARA